jgi:hypothetical protein
VVGVTVRQNESEQRRIACCEAGDARHQVGRVCLARIQGQAQVEQDAAAPAGQLDASPADLLRPTVDADAETGDICAIWSGVCEGGSDATHPPYSH